MATGKVARRTAVGDVAALLDSPEVAALIAAVDGLRWTGRKGYGVRALVGACLVKTLFALPTWTWVAALIAEHPGLQAALGETPSVWACYRFARKLRENRPLLADCLDNIATSLREEFPDLGRDVAIDASDLPAFANGMRLVSQHGPERERFSDPDASWGHGSAVSTRKGGGFYGYKIHAAVCAKTGLPLAWRVETARRQESNFVAPLLDTLHARGYRPETCAMDKGYDNNRVYAECEERGCEPVIPLRGVRAKQQPILPIGIGGRLLPRIPRHTQRWRDLYRGRAVVNHEGQPGEPQPMAPRLPLHVAFGRIVRELREEQGVSQEELGNPESRGAGGAGRTCADAQERRGTGGGAQREGVRVDRPVGAAGYGLGLEVVQTRRTRHRLTLRSGWRKVVVSLGELRRHVVGDRSCAPPRRPPDDPDHTRPPALRFDPTRGGHERPSERDWQLDERTDQRHDEPEERCEHDVREQPEDQVARRVVRRIVLGVRPLREPHAPNAHRPLASVGARNAPRRHGAILRTLAVQAAPSPLDSFRKSLLGGFGEIRDRQESAPASSSWAARTLLTAARNVSSPTRSISERASASTLVVSGISAASSAVT